MEQNDQNKPTADKRKLSSKGRFELQEMKNDYLKTMLYWTFLAFGISTYVTIMMRKYYFRRLNPKIKGTASALSFCFFFVGMFWRGRQMADQKLSVNKAEIMRDEENFEWIPSNPDTYIEENNES